MEDLAKYPGLTRRNNIWYVRKRVPTDIADMYISDSVKRSLKTDSLDEAKKSYHVHMLEIQSDFDQKRKERDHPQDVDQLSQLSEASLLGLAFRCYRETQDRIDGAKIKNIGQKYSCDEIDDAIISTHMDKQDYVDALNSQNFEIVYSSVQRWLNAQSVSFDVQSNSYDLFCSYVIKALIFMLNNHLKEFSGKHISAGVPDVFAPVTHIKNSNISSDFQPMLLDDLLERFLKQEERKEFDDKTNAQYRRVVKLLQNYAGRALFLHDVTRVYVEDYRNTLLRYPSRAHTLKAFKGKSFHEVLEIAEGVDAQLMNASTINTHTSNLHSLFSYAELNDFIPKNPIKKLMLVDQVADKDKRPPWPLSKLRDIFTMPLFNLDNPKQFVSKNDEPLYWCCLISLWAGMNLKEIVNLHVSDLKNEEGILYLNVVSRPEEGSKLKTAYRIRKVPLHSELKKLGLPEFFKGRAKHERLFYELTNQGVNGVGDPVSKRFFTLIDRYGVRETGSKETGKCGFHSLRHNYRDALRDTEMNIDIQHALGGWSTGAKKTVADNYGSGYTLKKLNDNLQRISYCGLDLSYMHK